MIQQGKRLYRSNDRVIAGVLGGWAQYLGLDPSLLRIAFVVLSLIVGFFPQVFLYPFVGLLAPEQLLTGLAREAFYGVNLPVAVFAYLIIAVPARFAPVIFAYALIALIVPRQPRG
jgi:phage shock protein C